MSLTAVDARAEREPAHGWVLAAPFRAHLRHVASATGLPWRALALAAGVEPALVRALLHGRAGRPLKRLHPESAARLLRLGTDTAAQLSQQVAAGPVHALLRDLVAEGAGEAELAAWLQLPRAQVRALADGSATSCTARTALLASALSSARGVDAVAA
ncbi:hypothetical protein GC722_15180 [Auraticoccus sp. F435]|uniref:Uncharacterized protein n=1 Tax=Auraticoccus cholistanensis TaxID=2656650 RepID=A0A6A9UWX3_9ACTN|nr:hypothetical protein [Auraticoccus cholistanensis]MVA77353.1 hypothetical protein [Auraticoccus cholistanensis]